MNPRSAMDPALARLQGLAANARSNAAQAQRFLQRGEAARAIALLDAALAEAPEHPELLRLRGLSEHFGQRSANAVALLRKAAAAWPDDALTVANLGAALAQHGDIDEAIAALGRATALDPMLLDAWFNLGRALALRRDGAGAQAAFDAVLEIEPRHRAARILRAETLKMLGRIGESESELRDVLREDPSSVPAWTALSNLKSPGAAADVEALGNLHRTATLAPTERIDIAFAYAAALETAERSAEAFAMFREANAICRRTIAWDARAVGALVDTILAAFPAAEPEPSRGAAAAGHEVVFLVGMPRSGSTLAEQILAAHPDVAAGGETGWVAEILQAESVRRGIRFPLWAAQAACEDWTRLGAEYLARANAQRRTRRVFTDKTLTNWQTLGALRRMLPASRIVHCRRDALETAWSCYKHHFAGDQLYSYDFDELAAFFGDSLRAMREWNERHPDWIRAHVHEDLIAAPEAATRALLSACGLAFDPACLCFERVEREVHTASAAQVREPLRAGRSAAARYGALLDPLRAALAAYGVAAAPPVR
ncbi:MAG TPA: sulfotransferase [Rhodanobacteraceae bacterium]|nr:sulfotransferase [Rhodanobacteraceae bacterium]